MKPEEKPVVEVELAGSSGNIFQVMANASTKLREVGRNKEAKEMVAKVQEAKSYEEALEVIEEYAELRRH